MRDLDEERALRENPLLASYAGDSHDRLRARVLRAVERLDPGLAATTSSERQYRLHQIVVRCDLNGQSHKEVADVLGISRRQFYLDRRAAFLLLADSLEEAPPEPWIEGPSSDALSMRLGYVEMMREQGRFDAVWRELLGAVREMRGQRREIEVWTVAAEAARYLGYLRQSLEVVEQMSRIADASSHQDLRRASALRIAICEIALQWMEGNIDAALARVDRASAVSGNERTMYGRDATLFAILLEYGAELSVERGEWQRAETLIRRAERIIDRSELPYAAARQQRVRARIAREKNGDNARAALELHDALRTVQQHKQLPAIAKAAVEYGIALAGADRAEAMKYVDYGLTMAKDSCGYDQCAVFYANAAPLLMDRSGPDEILRGIDELRRRSPLARHADLVLGVAEADARLARGEVELVVETAGDLARSLENASLFPVAAKARLISIEGLARGGKLATAKQMLKKSKEFVNVYGEYSTRRRADQIALFLHSSVK